MSGEASALSGTHLYAVAFAMRAVGKRSKCSQSIYVLRLVDGVRRTWQSIFLKISAEFAFGDSTIDNVYIPKYISL